MMLTSSLWRRVCSSCNNFSPVVVSSGLSFRLVSVGSHEPTSTAFVTTSPNNFSKRSLFTSTGIQSALLKTTTISSVLKKELGKGAHLISSSRRMSSSIDSLLTQPTMNKEETPFNATPNDEQRKQQNS